MYTPPVFKPDRAASLAFAEARGFGLACAWDGARPIACPLPFYLTYAGDGTPRALFHVARHNPLIKLAGDKMTAPRLEAMKKAIMGLEMTAEAVESSSKLNRHKSETDFAAVGNTLALQAEAGARAIVALMREVRPQAFATIRTEMTTFPRSE